MFTKSTVILSSLVLCTLGLAAFFIPENLLALLGENSKTILPVQLYGSCLLGFGFANWHIRNSPLGGIYGRAIVTGNIIHFLSGVGILIGLILGGQTDVGPLVLFTIYAALTVIFISILFSDGLSKKKEY